MNTNFRYIIILLLANLLFLSSEANGQNLSPASGEINGHQWVDLGLPSGLKWATCNVGASTPEDPGDYFAYGEVSEKDSYVFNNSINLKKEIRHISGRSEYDAATVHWCKEWRTGAHFVALQATEKGVTGYNTFRNSTGPDAYGPSLEAFVKKQKWFGTVLIGIRKKK